MALRPVLFWDIDGTLIECGASPLEILLDVCRDITGYDDFPREVSSAGRTDGDIVEELLSQAPSAPSVEDVLATYELALEARLSVPRVLPGVREVLSACRDRGWASYLLTGNTHKNAETKLRRAGIGPELLAIEGCFCIGVMRRADVALQATGYLTPDDIAIVIGDTPADIAASTVVPGARCLALATGRYSVGELAAAHVALERMSMPMEFARIVESLVRAGE